MDSLFPRSLSTHECLGLADIPSGEEIKQVIFSMANGTSPGPDGLSPLFFKFTGISFTGRLLKRCSTSLKPELSIKPSIIHILLSFPKKISHSWWNNLGISPFVMWSTKSLQKSLLIGSNRSLRRSLVLSNVPLSRGGP